MIRMLLIQETDKSRTNNSEVRLYPLTFGQHRSSNVSKLLLLFAVRELAMKSSITADFNLVINDVTRGMCKSDLFRDDVSWLLASVRAALVFLIARTTEVGSRTLVDTAKPDITPEAHGRFLMNCSVT